MQRQGNGVSLEPRGGRSVLLAQPELSQRLAVGLRVFPCQISLQPASAADEHQKPPARVVIMLVLAQMLRQLCYPAGEERDLNGRRAHISRMRRKLFYSLGFLFDSGQ